MGVFFVGFYVVVVLFFVFVCVGFLGVFCLFVCGGGGLIYHFVRLIKILSN